jgi:hypothetical protein
MKLSARIALYLVLVAAVFAAIVLRTGANYINANVRMQREVAYNRALLERNAITAELDERHRTRMTELKAESKSLDVYSRCMQEHRYSSESSNVSVCKAEAEVARLRILEAAAHARVLDLKR